MKTEKALIVLFLIGIFMRLMNWPGNSVLVMFPLIILAFLYFPFGFYFFRNKVLSQNLLLSILAGLSLSIALIGILFKLQYWSAGNMYNSIGTITALVVLLTMFLLKNKASEAFIKYYQNMLLRSVVIVIVSSLLFFTDTATLLKIQYRKDPELAKLKTLYYLNPQNSEYKKEHDEYLKKRDSLTFVE
jgi:hypothetical protein